MAPTSASAEPTKSLRKRKSSACAEEEIEEASETEALNPKADVGNINSQLTPGLDKTRKGMRRAELSKEKRLLNSNRTPKKNTAAAQRARNAERSRKHYHQNPIARERKKLKRKERYYKEKEARKNDAALDMKVKMDANERKRRSEEYKEWYKNFASRYPHDAKAKKIPAMLGECPKKAVFGSSRRCSRPNVFGRVDTLYQGISDMFIINSRLINRLE